MSTFWILFLTFSDSGVLNFWETAGRIVLNFNIFELLEYASYLKGKNNVKLSHSARSGKNNQPSGLCTSEESTNNIFVNHITSKTGKSTSHFWIFLLIFREKFIIVGIPFQVEKVCTQILHVLHVRTTVGPSQMASCQVWLNIVGVYIWQPEKPWLVQPISIKKAGILTLLLFRRLLCR